MSARELAAPAGAAVAALAAAHLLPSVAAIGPLRRAAWPTLSGRWGTGHIGLTFDDGPDPASTPAVLSALRELDLRATFFVVGERLRDDPQLARRIVEDGHELGVHGWTHRPQLLCAPVRIRADLIRTTELVQAVAGVRPAYWRPPHGIPTGAGLLAGRALGLRAVLWTVDGADWRGDADARTIEHRIARRTRPGDVVLLHDSDAFGAPGSWRRMLAALPALAAGWRRRGWPVGPLAEHGLPPAAITVPAAAGPQAVPTSTGGAGRAVG